MLGVAGGLYFLLAAFVVAWIVRSFLVNDKKSPNHPDRGLLAMSDRRKQLVRSRWTPERSR